MSGIAVTAYRSPMGWLRLEATDAGLTAISFEDGVPADADPGTSHPMLRLGLAALRAYFSGDPVPKVPFDLQGTIFQQQVWEALQEIPFGETWSYRQLAEVLGDAKKVRAVGTANGKNPIAILIPCHRVIGADGSLTGYAGGLDRKQALLTHEGIETLEAKLEAQTSLW